MAFLREKSGAWSPEKVVAFIGALLPALWLAGRVWMDDLGPRPAMEAIHFAGFWTVRLLWITLAVTPAARIFRYSRLVLARRILGVAAFTYALFHLALFTLDQKFNFVVVAAEIVQRIYLTIGFTALLGLSVLAATSTDGAIRRLGGRRWTRLHLAVYAIAVVAQTHFLLQAKNDVYEPTLMAGLLMWLFGWRLIKKFGGEVTLPRLIGLAAAAAALTALGETAWYRFMTGVNAWMVFLANFDFSYQIRPAWWVLASALAVVAAAWGWRWRKPPQRTTARKISSAALSGGTQVQPAN